MAPVEERLFRNGRVGGLIPGSCSRHAMRCFSFFSDLKTEKKFKSRSIACWWTNWASCGSWGWAVDDESVVQFPVPAVYMLQRVLWQNSNDISVFNNLKQRKTVNLHWFPVGGLTEAQEVERFSTNWRVDGSIPSPERLHVVMCPWARDISWTSLCSWWLFRVIVTLDVQLAARVCQWVKAHLCFKWLLRL